jgi:hypothetical protein
MFKTAKLLTDSESKLDSERISSPVDGRFRRHVMYKRCHTLFDH